MADLYPCSLSLGAALAAPSALYWVSVGLAVFAAAAAVDAAAFRVRPAAAVAPEEVVFAVEHSDAQQAAARFGFRAAGSRPDDWRLDSKGARSADDWHLADLDSADFQPGDWRLDSLEPHWPDGWHSAARRPVDSPAQACRVVPDDSPNCPSAARRLVLRLLQLSRLLAQALVEVHESAKRRPDVRHLPALPAFAE